MTSLNLDTIVCGDCLDVMGGMEDSVVDTIITDPPYGLNFMSKNWDHGIPGVRYWREALRVAKPGAFLLAFGGTRTWHRLACAIEDAGWEIRDTMMWLYGSGFPKSHNISKAIDKAAGAEREVVGYKVEPNGRNRINEPCAHDGGDSWGPNARFKDTLEKRQITAPATAPAAQWDGWGTALKPAWEPVLVCMKPLDSTFAANALAHGVAGLWIDGARVGLQDGDTKVGGFGNGKVGYGGGDARGVEWKQDTQGRWPANVALVHSPDCVRVGTRRVGNGQDKYNDGDSVTPSADGYCRPNASMYTHKRDGKLRAYGKETVDAWQCVDDCPARLLGAQSGERLVSGSAKNGRPATATPGFGYGTITPKSQGSLHNDTGTAARFFYQAKASRSERSDGCEDFYWKRDGKQLVRISRDEWESLSPDERTWGNIHPTVKPLGMLEYLCKLTRTPTGGIVFDPFIGSGTTAIAAIRTGRRFYGCDNNQDYVDIANARIEKARLELAQMELPHLP